MTGSELEAAVADAATMGPGAAHDKYGPYVGALRFTRIYGSSARKIPNYFEQLGDAAKLAADQMARFRERMEAAGVTWTEVPPDTVVIHAPYTDADRRLVEAYAKDREESHEGEDQLHA